MYQHKATTKQKGDLAELKAISYLEDNGFKIIEKNFYAKKLGEIDIIASKDNVYHFVEVKSGDSFEAVYNITASKLRKLYNSIQYYLKTKNLDIAYCIDAIIISNNDLEFLENISL
ncbi:MAG: YraN family protein [Campylobacteraceae bacterium]|nr:YraN family protein [Campylobacteraceae bacterium]MBT3881814.1 YraN family protein [Campylobacteraceae bacterium]MBT4030098.1 YraN family protein [Campylobacteraceae bacterium]MBT4179829.1 YraN family protein [Campylobacteraceae bacterium]MBT4571970.1 YraN family protein [Campylobacteraceae bacterium]